MGRFLDSRRRLGCLLLLGVLAFVSGCGDDKAAPSGPTSGAAEKQQQEDQRAAREKAYGPGGMPTDTPKK
jgi:hypothetical protein